MYLDTVFAFMHAFIYSFIHSFIHSIKHSLNHLFVCSFICAFIHPSIHSLVHAFMHSFNYPFIHSFIQAFLLFLAPLPSPEGTCKPLSSCKPKVLSCRQTVTPSSRCSPPPVSVCLFPSTTQLPKSWQPNTPSSEPCCKCAPNSARAATQQQLWTS